MRGEVVRFDPDRGIGAIKAGAVPDHFVVRIDDVAGVDELTKGQSVEFDVVPTKRGGLLATNVKAGRKPLAPVISYTVFGVVFAASSMIMLTVGFGVHWLLAWLLAVNLVSFSFYGWDKSSAESGSQRVPERSLHYLEGAGGSVAAIAGRQYFPDETRERRFLITSWAILAVHGVLLIAYLRRWGFDLPM